VIGWLDSQTLSYQVMLESTNLWELKALYLRKTTQQIIMAENQCDLGYLNDDLHILAE